MARKELAPFLEVPRGARLGALLASIDRGRAARTIDFLVELNRRLHSEIRYTIRLEPGVQTPEETLDARSGSCRDTAWLLVQMRSATSASRAASSRAICIQLVGRREGARRPHRRRGRTSPICTRGPRCTCRARAGSGSTRRPACSRAKGHIPLACTPRARERGADHGRRSSECESSSSTR